MPDRAVRVDDFPTTAALPPAARALFGQDAFSTEGWYRSVAEAALPSGSAACFQVVSRGADILALVPMLRSGEGYAALTTPYTVQWSPMLRTGLTDADMMDAGRALGGVWRRWPRTRLDALDAAAPWFRPLLRGVRRAGLLALHFDHFGNWHLPVGGLGWDAYLAGRPGALRSAIERRSRTLVERKGAVLCLTDGLTDGPEGLDAALTEYERVYAASWKQTEPFPHFTAALLREAAASGSLRLGVLRLAGVPIAAQYWLLHRGPSGGWAGVQKLAHDEAYRKLAPGTVLTALMLRNLLQDGGITDIDFGRGDDEYKQQWTGERRQRSGVILAAPWQPAGFIQAARHLTGRILRRLRGGGKPRIPGDVAAAGG